MLLSNHPMIRVLKGLKGNPRACVLLEPLWGVPFNLYFPFVSLYMFQLGVPDERIGLLLTVGMLFQMISLVFGSVLVDRIGRRRSTLLFDLLRWSVPTLLWMLAQGFWWFFAAAIFNGLFHCSQVSYHCLLSEDAEPSKLVDIYTWTTVAGLLSVLFAPVAGIMVRSLSLVPALRILYGFAFVLMTAKSILLYRMTTETKQGVIRMEESRSETYGQMLHGYRDVLKQIFRTPATLQILAILVFMQIAGNAMGTFFPLFAVQNAGAPDWLIAYIPMIGSLVMLVFYFTLQHRIDRFPLRRTMAGGLFLFLAGIALFLVSPVLGLAVLIASVLVDATGEALVRPREQSLLVLYVDPQERARVTGLLQVLLIALAAPFGWITGWLSSISRYLPFLLAALMYLLCAVVLLFGRPVEQDALSEKQAGAFNSPGT